ncbi:MAG TPA: YkoF family thiamine/hydroxymethylpyrimidine-binding protein [Coriobacteriia bacterium]|nr:YkoF family thiamine/hydroxymethylpyrimidine-binding protein [Coriobacteriia bacterium]
MSAHESASETQVGLQFSVYPLRQAHLHPAIEAAVQAAAGAGVDVTVGRLSTFAPGDEDSVFAAVQAAFDAAKSFGPTVMVVTLSSGLPSEDTVAEIQDASKD